MTEFATYPSLRGQVAFVANTAQGSGLWVDSPLMVPSLDNIKPSWSDSNDVTTGSPSSPSTTPR